jgi:hypothetical protein
MSIPVTCGQCGWRATVKDELAGQKGKCPTCGEPIPIPKKGIAPPAPPRRKPDADDEPEVVEDELRSRSKPGSRPASISTRRRNEDEDDRPRRRRDDDDEDDRPSKSRRRRAEDDDEDDRPRTRHRARDDDYDDDDDRSRRRRKKARKKPEHTGWFGLESRVLSAGVIGGTIAMVIAIVWFVIGLFADIIFFYPPILFVIGLIAFIKGLVSAGE